MKMFVVALGAISGLTALGGTAHPASADTMASTAPVITVSCFRGPLKAIIWDHANAEFIDSLIALGYDYVTAEAIGERICRDINLVDNPDATKAATIEAYNNSPYARTHRR